MAMLPVNGRIYELVSTSRSHPCVFDERIFSVQRLPTDPLFYADVVLQNIVSGSRYWIAQASDLSNVLATGVAEDTEITINSVPAYASPMLIEVRVRSASGETKYYPYKTYGYLVREGVSVYIAQAEDTVAA